MRIAILCAVLAVIGCASHDGGPEIDCSTIHIVTYPSDFEDKLVAELKAAPATSVWPSAIADYRATRHALLACQQAGEKH
jgi:hypothetical protein